MLIPISKLMFRSSLSAAEFLAAAKTAYVRAAMLEIAQSSKGRQNMSRVAAAIGLTRREIATLLKRSAVEPVPLSSENYAVQPLRRVVNAWLDKPAFLSRQKKPRVLPITGTGTTFESLVKSCGGDVPVMAVLKELERIGCVRRVGSSGIRLVRAELYQPGYDPAAIHKYSDQIGTFAESLELQKKHRNDKVVVRETSNVPLEMVPIFIRTFSERANMLLEGFDTWVRRNSRQQKAQEQGRIGVGVYLILPNPQETGRK